MSKRRLVFETQTKRFFEGPEPSSLVENLRDSSDARTMLNGRISEYLMQGLDHVGVPTHFIRRLNMRETLIHHVEMLPFSVFVRNRADEAYAKAMDFEVGAILPAPILEFHYHNSLGDMRVLGQDELIKFELCTKAEFDEIQNQARRAFDFLAAIYWSIGYFLIDVSLEFGRQEVENYKWQLILSDDIGPLQSQLWDFSSSDEQNILRPELEDVAQRFGVQ